MIGMQLDSLAIAGTLTVTSLWVSSGLSVANGGFTQTGSPFVVASDKRIKTEIVPVSGALNKISSLKGVYFNWRKDKVKEFLYDDRRHLGLIAQDVLRMVPEAIDTVHSNQYLGVDYGSLVSLLIAGFDELRQYKNSRSKVTRDFLAQLESRIKLLNGLIARYALLQQEQEHLLNETLKLRQTHEHLVKENQSIEKILRTFETRLS
jgi:hypothetical protein